MAVSEFELLHGIVLTGLMRADHPSTVRLMEHDKKGGWSVYTVSTKTEGDIRILIKTSISPRATKLKGKKAGTPGHTWQHSFSDAQIAEVKKPATWAALVCGSPNLKSRIMEVCVLDPQDLAELIDIGPGDRHSVTVHMAKGNKLHVSSSKWKSENGKAPKKVTRRRIEEI
jgi:hypothetical protein